MTMIKNIVAVFILLFFSAGSLSAFQTEMHLEKMYTIGHNSEEGPLLGQIHDAAFDGDTKLYLVDGGNKSIHQYDENGNYIKSFGRDGRGPGEFSEVTAMTYSEEEKKLCAIDYPGARIICFENNEEKTSTTINLQSTSAIRTNKLISFNSRLLLLGSHQAENAMIHEIGENGETLNSIGEFIDFEKFQHNPNGKMQLSQVHASRHDEMLLVSTAAPNRSKLYDHNLNLIREFENGLLPKPWETHMTMEANRYSSEFYSMSVANQILSEEIYLFFWSEVLDSKVPVIEFHLELRSLKNGEKIASKSMNGKYLLGMHRLSDSSALLLLRSETYDYEVYRVVLN